jgi:hypothetical protein
VELQEELQKLLFSVSLFFDSPMCRKVSKINCVFPSKIYCVASEFTAVIGGADHVS